MDDVRVQSDGLHDLAAAACYSALLKPVTDAVEQHNTDRLGIILNGKRAQRCN